MKGLPRSISRGLQAQQPIVKITLAFNDLAIAVANGAAAPGFGTKVLGGLPQGNLLFLGATVYAQFLSADADVITTFEGDFSIGTAPTADAVLSGAEIDIIPSTPLGPAVAKLTPMHRAISTTAVTGAIYDNTDGSLELNLNVLIDDASQTNAVDLTLDGYVVVALIVLGDD